MSARPLAGALLLCAVASGCLIDEDREDIRDIFGRDRVFSVEGNLYIAGATLEGRFVDEDTEQEWSDENLYELMARKVTLEKPNPGPQGGGGQTIPLGIPSTRAHLEVRFIDAKKLEGLEARWIILRGLGEEPSPLPSDYRPGPAPSATEPFAVPLDQPGFYKVYAQLVKDGKILAYTVSGFFGTVNVHWLYDSSVFPLRAPAGPAPSNYEAMADKFTITLDRPVPSLDARTAFMGNWPSADGTDVDLELDGPDGKPVRCAAATVAGGPDPAHAIESLSYGGSGTRLDPGVWTVRVGARQNVPDCVRADPTYANSGPVPYGVDILLRFS